MVQRSTDGAPAPISPGDGRRGGYYGSLMGGGIVNHKTGMGLAGDKSESSFFVPTIYTWRTPLEIIHNQSWAAKKFIQIPVDDMFIRWREFDMEGGVTEASVEAMRECEMRHRVRKKLSNAMKAGRLYGSALLVMVTREAPLHEPLVPERVRQGDLLNLFVIDRYSASVKLKDTNLFSATYGEPLVYTITPFFRGQSVDVHASRCIRFDGIEPLTTEGYSVYQKDWGVSEIVPVVLSIIQDAQIAQGAAHLTQEASVPILKVAGLREALAGQAVGSDEMTAEEIGAKLNELRSIYRMLMMDSTEEFTREPAHFAGLPQLMDQAARRLAASAGIPATRFWGQSPLGMNATGESDHTNYLLMVEALREEKTPDAFERLDEVLAGDAGLSEALAFSWPSLLDTSEQDQVQTDYQRTQAVDLALRAGVIDEPEGREMLSGTEVFGDLEGGPPEPPDPELPPVGGGAPGAVPPGGGDE